MRNRRAQQSIATGLAATSAVLGVLTIIWPEWIEALFGVDPDNKSGALEWAITIGLFTLACLFSALARSLRRRPIGVVSAGDGG